MSNCKLLMMKNTYYFPMLEGRHGDLQASLESQFRTQEYRAVGADAVHHFCRHSCQVSSLYHGAAIQTSTLFRYHLRQEGSWCAWQGAKLFMSNTTAGASPPWHSTT